MPLFENREESMRRRLSIALLAAAAFAITPAAAQDNTGVPPESVTRDTGDAGGDKKDASGGGGKTPTSKARDQEWKRQRGAIACAECRR